MLIGRFLILIVACLSSVYTLAAQESQTLASGQPVEREIAGGQSHTYRFKLEAGQFIRALLEQKGIDIALELASPDDQKHAAVNLTRPGGIESISAESASAGDYQLTVRA